MHNTFSQAWWLTAGADTFVGTSGNDIINALTVKADGTAATTLSAFDSIDGGAGNDTLNIFADGTSNTSTLAANVTVKNVETININNSGAGFGAVDASKFVGATLVNQVGVASAVTNLAAGTVAGFNALTATSLAVTAATAATTANVALTAAKGVVTTNVATLAIDGAALTGVTVTGTIAQTTTTAGAAAASLALNVVLAKDVQAGTVNTAVKTTLTIGNDAATSTKALTSVDASASTGAVTYTSAGTAVQTIKTGAGNDTVTIQTTTSNTVGAVVDALVDTGAGDDKITVSTTGTGKTTINAGAGNDTITLTVGLNTAARIDGGAGTDKLVLSTGGTLVAGDYALIGATVSNVEQLAFGAAAVADASKLAQFSELTFFSTGTNTVTEVASTQALIATGDLTASAAGYKAAVAAPATAAVYAGSVNVTSKAALAPGAQAIVVNADAATVTVAAGSGTTAGVAASQTSTTSATITGDVKTLAIVTANGVDNADLTTAAAKADTLSVATVTVTANNLAALTTLTLSGNGSITLNDSAAATGTIKLATIDASALGGTLTYGATAGNVTGGLTFTGNAFVAETIKLGAGSDVITINSTYGKMDTITGFDSVKETNTLKSTTDVLKFSTLDTSLAGVVANAVATKVTLSANATTVDLAFVEAAAASGVTTNNAVGSVVFFQFGGDTYVFQDSAAVANTSNTNQKVLDAGDLAVKLVGLHNFAIDFDAFVVV